MIRPPPVPQSRRHPIDEHTILMKGQLLGFAAPAHSAISPELWMAMLPAPL